MFNNDRYISNGINTEIELFLQLLMWEMVDEMQVEQKNYLQVFKLEPILVNGDMVQEITHTQEQPRYEKRIVLNKLTKPVKAKIFVIDSDTYSTMLLASEY